MLQEIIEEDERLLKKYLDVARKMPAKLKLNSFLMHTKRSIEHISLINPQSSEVCHFLQILTRVSIAIFAEATVTEGEVEIDLDTGLTIHLSAKGPTDSAAANNWFNGFYAALILRDTAALDALSNVPLDILRHSRSRGDECMYLFIDALQGMWKREKDAMQRLLNAARATAPDQLSIDPDYVLNIIVPEIELFYRFLTLDKPKFNEVLAYALDRHKIYWSQEDNKLSPSGFIAWGALAAAGLAYDINFPIEVESDYLPLRLLHGECRV